MKNKKDIDLDERIEKLEQENKALKNRCYALSGGTMCFFCHLECENRICDYRNKEIDGRLMNLYWNERIGRVEYIKSNDNYPIINSQHDDGIVIESWYTDNTHSQVINFSYARGYERDRNRFFRDNNVLQYETKLRWIMIPKSEYEQLIKQYASEDKMEVEE